MSIETPDYSPGTLENALISEASRFYGGRLSRLLMCPHFRVA